MTSGWYDTAQICLGGHVINPVSVSSPVHNKRFCDRCGKATVTVCQDCTSPIRGPFHDSGGPKTEGYVPPNFCHNCGVPYPWTRQG